MYSPIILSFTQPHRMSKTEVQPPAATAFFLFASLPLLFPAFSHAVHAQSHISSSPAFHHASLWPIFCSAKKYHWIPRVVVLVARSAGTGTNTAGSRPLAGWSVSPIFLHSRRLSVWIESNESTRPRRGGLIGSSRLLAAHHITNPFERR